MIEVQFIVNVGVHLVTYASRHSGIRTLHSISSARHWSCGPSAWLALRWLVCLSSSSLSSLLLLMLPKHLCILVRARCSCHAIDHAGLLLGTAGRGIHRILSHVVPGHLVLHQALLQVLQRGPVCLLLSDVWVFGPDLVLNLYELRLYLRRELSRLLWHARRTR